MKFIGHLDIMRYFQKAHIRAGLDVSYSEGFNPHQIMSFAAPLGVGITSDGEYLDIAVNSTLSSKESMEALNRVMVEGMEVLEYKKLPDDSKKSMSLVAAADYYVYPKEEDALFLDLKTLQNKINDFLAQPEILVTKKTKKSEATIDIKPHVYTFGLDFFNSKQEQCINQCSYFMSVATGSEINIRPELVVEAFHKFIGCPFDENCFQIHRSEVYAKTENGFVTLGSLGEEIES